MAAKKKPAQAEPEPDAGDEQAEGAPKPLPLLKRLPLKLIIMGVTALLLLGGGAVGYMVFFKKSGNGQTAAATPVKPPVFLDLPDTLVNLSNTGSERTQYLKVKIVLELPDQTMAQQVQPMLPRVMDAFQTYLRELRPTDLDGSAGLYRLKEELTRRVNASIAPNRVNAILFREIVVQ
ncbi:MAG: flagellar basal body-associated protein FliL [Pseudorhodoplanes sp.]|jgi:flagellar FliL protein|nr:flagellar basal body-associated protein FliL [Pseudorhodoplanes sp.]